MNSQIPSEDVFPERLQGSGTPKARALRILHPTSELHERKDPSTSELFAAAGYEFEPAGIFWCRTGAITLEGLWKRHRDGTVLEVQATSEGGSTFDGFLTRTEDRWRLSAVFTTTTYHNCAISLLRDDLDVAQARGRTGKDSAHVPAILDPHVEARLAAADELWESISRRFGITDNEGSHRSTFPIDVLVPEFDVTITPADGFLTAPSYQGTLLCTPDTDSDHLTVTVYCHGSIDAGWLSWSVKTNIGTAFTSDGEMTIVDDQAHLGIGPGTLAWYSGQTAPALRLSRSRLSLRFEPDTWSLTGKVSAVDADGGHRVAHIKGTVRGRTTEKLRRIVAHACLCGRWRAVIGPLRKLTVPCEDAKPGPARVTTQLATGPAFVRLAVGPDLAVGLTLTDEDSVPIVLRREDFPISLLAEADDRLSLGHLAKDLALAGRHAVAAPLLRHATELTWALEEVDPDFTTGNLISLISLIDHQVIGAFALGDYPALLDNLAQAVRLRRRLAVEPHTLSSFLRIYRDRARNLDSTVESLADLVPMVDKGCVSP